MCKYGVMRFVFISFILFVFAGCVGTEPKQAEITKQNSHFSHFKEKFFESWDDENETVAFTQLAALSFSVDKNEWYGENLMPIRPSKVQRAINAASEAKNNKLFKNAITVANADIRILPTEKPFFKDPRLAGEGYPFDYLQNSRIYISTPIKLLYETQKKDYYFVKTPVGYGWIDARKVAFTHIGFEDRFRSSALKTPLDDKKPLHTESGVFVERLNIGTVLPDGYYPAKDDSARAVWKRYAKDKELCKMPAALDETAVALAAYSLYGEPYGWGGYLDNRDCSMFLRDIFVSFGVFLPRNSASQAAGYTDLSGMEIEAKKEHIKANAKPFRTLVYLKGHIMLYAGVDSYGEPLVMHDAWGIKSFEGGKEGRKMLGGIVVTTMEEGKGEPWFDENKSSLLFKTLGIKNIY